MTIFVVLRVQDAARMKAALAEKYPEDHLDLGNDEWLVSAKGTAKGLSDHLGVTSDPATAGNAIIFSMDSYFGRASADIWEWIKAKSEATNG